jgi:glycosyltransferase involved in cell wall biosynthesis
MKKPVILVVMDYYLPAYKAGGPVRSISNMVELLAGEFDFFIVARDRDCDDSEPFPGIDTDRWLERDGCRVRYVRGPGSLRNALKNLDPDLIYLNSFFSTFAIATLALRRLGLIRRAPVLLAPRGELSPRALGLKKTKKRCFLAAARLAGLHRGVVWQASSAMEREEIARYSAGRVGVTPNIPARVEVDEADLRRKPSKRAGSARFVFLSRLARKKNLAFALRLLKEVEGRVVFDVYGTPEDRDYVERCAGLMDELPDDVAARFLGPVPPDRVHETLLGYHFFLFPTLNENFGHVILEALLAGLPVITSDQTYWRNLEHSAAGWDIDLDDRDEFLRRLRQCIALDGPEYERMSRSAQALATAYLKDPRAVEATRRLLHETAAGAAGGI